MIRMIIAAVMAAAVLLTACGKKELSDTQKQEISTELTQFIGRMNISGSVYLVHNGGEILDLAQGDLSGRGSDILYGVASLTKQITAACIMRLYDEGKLDINDTLDKYFPDYRYGDWISIEKLLCQRSGVTDYSVDSVDGEVVVTCDGSLDSVTITAENTAEENRRIIREFFMSKPLLFEPGEYFYYSDSNYALLAEIVSQVSGMDYHEYVRRNIFEPLGMDNAAFIDDNSADVSRLAPADGTEFDGSYYDYKGAEYGCGDMLCTTGDLYKWYKGLTGGRVVSDSSYKLMTKNYSKEGELGYGFGLMISEDGDAEVLYHYGWIPSSYSSMFMIPGQDIFAAVLCNSSRGYPHNAASAITKRYCEYIGLKIGEIS